MILTYLKNFSYLFSRLGWLMLLFVFLWCGVTNAIAAQDGNPDDKMPITISGGVDNQIKRWGNWGKLENEIGTLDGVVEFLTISKSLLISCGSDGTLKFWSLETRKPTFSIIAHKGGITALAVNSSGELLATGGNDNAIRFWDVPTGQKLGEIEKPHSGAVLALKFTSDTSKLVSGSADKSLRIWRVNRRDRFITLEYQSNIIAHDDDVNDIAISPDDKEVASVSSDGFLKIWKFSGGAMIHRVKLGAKGNRLAYNPDGSLLATGDDDGKLRLWNPTTSMPLGFMGNHERGIACILWSPDGKLLASGGADKTLRWWNVSTGRQVVKIAAHDGTVKALALP